MLSFKHVLTVKQEFKQTKMVSWLVAKGNICNMQTPKDADERKEGFHRWTWSFLCDSDQWELLIYIFLKIAPICHFGHLNNLREMDTFQ